MTLVCPRVLRFLSWLSSCALAQHSVTRTKNFSNRARPAPAPSTTRTRTQSSAGSRTRPANAGTRNPHGLTRSVQDSRSYHLTDYEWTSLSQNLAWKATMHSAPAAEGTIRRPQGFCWIRYPTLRERGKGRCLVGASSCSQCGVPNHSQTTCLKIVMS